MTVSYSRYDNMKLRNWREKLGFLFYQTETIKRDQKHLIFSLQNIELLFINQKQN